MFKDYIDGKERREILEELRGLDKKWAERLEKLLERKEKMTSEGNFYGEVYTERQWDLALTPIFNKERIRVEIMKYVKEKGEASVKEISEELGIPGKVVLFNIVELVKRKTLELSRIKDTTPLYRYIGEGHNGG